MNRELASYCIDKLDFGPDFRLEWSADGKEFTPLGKPITMVSSSRPSSVRVQACSTTTPPVRPVVMPTSTTSLWTPRVACIEREIPIGKTVVLTSSADGSNLAADMQKSVLVDALSARPGNAESFQSKD